MSTPFQVIRIHWRLWLQYGNSETLEGFTVLAQNSTTFSRFVRGLNENSDANRFGWAVVGGVNGERVLRGFHCNNARHITIVLGHRHHLDGHHLHHGDDPVLGELR